MTIVRCFVFMLLAAVFVLAEQPVAQYTLGPDDQVKIWSLGMEEITAQPVRIDPSGDIDLPMVGKIHAGGLTVEQLKAKLVQVFARQVLKPQVSVEIVEYGSQPVSVMGAVNKPGIVQLRGRRTLSEVLSLVEGLGPSAGPRINISRPIESGAIPLAGAQSDPSGKFSVAEVGVKDLLEAKSPALNILILPHDVIMVPTAEVVFVMGDVKKPGEVALKERASISVIQALASAEGLGPTSAPQDSRIVRVVPGTKEPLQIPVDLRKVMEGKGEDIAMRPNDVLVVPPSGSKKVAARIIEAAIQTATGVVIWRRP